MAYRETERTRSRKERIRQSILDAARTLISEKGFRETSIADIAEKAGIATGSVYRYFTSKAELCAEVFRMASQREVDQVQAACTGPGTETDQLRAAIHCFARRALKGRRMAYALIAEPIDPLVDADRLHYRQKYADVFEDLILRGQASGRFHQVDAKVAAAALVGALAEALVGPLAQRLSEGEGAETGLSDEAVVTAMEQFGINALVKTT
ncbi:TetR/AcrR family transcriptional regulator [Hahella sp. SMD15-11]|uniref:TetR/AcrR family transcriptional regulator n=1 Tax=Thermohahella caldifontis TaxID=3142973 RepID=A0AB39UVE0_9GAMM